MAQVRCVGTSSVRSARRVWALRRGCAVLIGRPYSRADRRSSGAAKNWSQVYYVLENSGVLEADGEEQEIREGDMIHLPPGTRYAIRNPHAEWLSYLIMAA